VRTLNSILATIFAVLVLLFAVSNLDPVNISIWPFPFQATLGVYAVVLIALLIGFLAGLIAAWFAGSGRRRERKRLRGQVKDLEQNLIKAQDTRTGT
jgi:uncharacterized integral membrane protein